MQHICQQRLLMVLFVLIKSNSCKEGFVGVKLTSTLPLKMQKWQQCKDPLLSTYLNSIIASYKLVLFNYDSDSIYVFTGLFLCDVSWEADLIHQTFF